MGRKEYWLKIRDKFSGYSWDYFMSEKSSTTAILKRQLQWIKASGIRVKTVRCDSAKEQIVPLKNMCWEDGVMVDYVAPYTPKQNLKVERQFPTDLKWANAMLDTVKLSVAHKMKLRKEAIQYASTMANISIKDGKSPYEKFFGVTSRITPETCVNFGRIGYVTYGNVLKNKYKPRRAFKCHMVGYAMNHSEHTYKDFKYEPRKPGKNMVTRNVRWEHWEHAYKPISTDSPLFTKVKGLNEMQKELY
jgi:hypothetical protein